MIDYRSQGALPARPHTVFRDEAGGLLHEHCFTREGFDGPFSILYHRAPPQDHGSGRATAPLWSAESAPAPALRRAHLRSTALRPGGSPATGRVPLLQNGDLIIGALRPTEDDSFALAHGDADDLFYIHQGGGTLWSWFGRLDFGAGDYLVVPRAPAHAFTLSAGPQHWLWVACKSGIRVPRQYRSATGQLRMDAPYTHRDFRGPLLEPAPAPVARLRELVTCRAGRFSRHTAASPIFDVVGWDGQVYPTAFAIARFSPRIGKYHLPPTVHGTFATGGSLICSFVPRNVDFGDGAIPCPYPHSNVAVYEVIFYCDGDFTSRRGIEAGSISLHPAGVPHGPHPGAYEASVGTTATSETAVMIDTFTPLEPTAAARAIEDPSYDESWSP